MSAAPHIALSARRLSAQLGGRAVFEDMHVDIAAGRWTAMVGPNGAGKSTLLKGLAGLLPVQGQVLLLGQDLAGLTARQRAQRLAWMGQHETGADDLSVYDVVMLGRIPYLGWLASPTHIDHAAVEQALGKMQAWDWRDRALGQLSAGERQRVLLARVLCAQTPVLLMDEPLANLDPPHQADWLQTVRALVRRGVTVLSVLHEVSMALQAEDLLLINQGKAVHHGATEDPATHHALETVFDHRIQVRQLDGVWLALPAM
jgi:iron complex transport system ATP-binding protein